MSEAVAQHWEKVLTQNLVGHRVDAARVAWSAEESAVVLVVGDREFKFVYGKPLGWTSDYGCSREHPITREVKFLLGDVPLENVPLLDAPTGRRIK